MQKLMTYLEKIQLTLGTVFLVIFVTATLIQVITRYLGISALWTEEISVNSFIWSMFLGAAVMVRHKAHFSFDLFNQKFSTGQTAVLTIFQDLVILVFCGCCAVYSQEITATFWNSRWTTLPGLRQGYVWLILPITFITMGLYLIEDIVKQYNVFKTKNASVH